MSRCFLTKIKEILKFLWNSLVLLLIKQWMLFFQTPRNISRRLTPGLHNFANLPSLPKVHSTRKVCTRFLQNWTRKSVEALVMLVRLCTSNSCTTPVSIALYVRCKCLSLESQGIPSPLDSGKPVNWNIFLKCKWNVFFILEFERAAKIRKITVHHFLISLLVP